MNSRYLWIVLAAAFVSVGIAGAARSVTPTTRVRHVDDKEIRISLDALTTTPGETNDDDEAYGGGPEREKEYFQDWLGGSIDPRRLHQMWDEALSTPSEPPPSGPLDPVNSWELIGPLWSTNAGGGRMTGRVRDIDAVHARVLAASGGLWRFYFGAVPMTESVPSSFYGTFVTNPFDDQTIILGTGENAYGGPAGTGVYKTTDGGATWVHKTTSPEPPWFSKIRYSTDGTVLYAGSAYGFYRSTDNGEAWARTGFPNQDVTDIATAIVTLNNNPGVVHATVDGQGLWRSDDYGVTWTQVAGGLPTSGTGYGAVVATTHLRSSPGYIYVSFTNAGVWRSQDEGASWVNITPGGGPARLTNANTISACPSNRDVVLLGGVGLHRSTDAGATWTLELSSNLHADYHVFAWDTDGNGVWTGNDGGWFHSTDQGFSWSSDFNVMPVTQFTNVSCEVNEFGFMLGGSQDNAISYCEFEGLVWNQAAAPSTEGDGSGVCLDVYNPGHMWGINGVPYGHYRTTNNGGTWQNCDNGIEDPGSHAGDIRTDHAFPVRLYTSSGRYVYESTDSGDSWTKTNPVGGVSFPASVNRLTASARVSPSAVLYASIVTSTPGGRLFVRDAGNWSERDSGLPAGASVRGVVPHPWAAYADEAWALMNGMGTPGQKVYRTNDRGLTWTNITGDLPNVPLGDLVPNPYNTNELFLGTFLGCYRTTDGGLHWERWNNGLTPAVMVTEMSYIDTTPSGGAFYVVAATFGRSVWQREISGADPSAVNDTGTGPGGLRLETVGPNPFEGQTALRFFLPERGPARLEVYDVRGRHISTATNGVYSAGSHILALDGKSLAPGVYFCRLQEGNRSAVQQVTVIR